MSNVRVLPDDVINKIAAGEVIENPASVVKELVENALDAGATEICIETKAGGRELIRISDNGLGMGADDAILCLERHATSKIRQIDDLNHLQTMGFRGEALSSIAAISKFSILTCQVGKTMGTLVIVDGGKVVKSAPAPRSPGTTIEVKSLFFNVPVRKKFQRSPGFDHSEIFKTVSAIALGHPNVKFQLIRDQETVLMAPKAADLRERIGQVLGKETLKNVIPLTSDLLQGVIGEPQETRPNRAAQMLYINQRPVFSPSISRAVREGYGTTIVPQRYPTFVLHLQIAPEQVDVNVHPQKREVRLRDEGELLPKISQEISRALQKKGGECLGKTAAYTFSPPSLPPRTLAETPAPYPIPLKAVQNEIVFEEAKESAPIVLGTVAGFILVDPSSAERMEKGAKGLVMVDQRRAHTRILFERLTKAQSVQEGHPLLVPRTVTVSSQEAEELKVILEELNLIGFSIREFGPNTFVVDALPLFFEKGSLEASLRELLHDLHEIGNKQERHLIQLALRAAVSKKMRLKIEEAQQLLQDLFACDHPEVCPQGKRTWVCISDEKLEAFYESENR